ncbi:hypothetical protein ACSZM2_12390 [Aeromonas hydrophila]
MAAENRPATEEPSTASATKMQVVESTDTSGKGHATMSMVATGKTIRTTRATGIMRDAELRHDNLGCWVFGIWYLVLGLGSKRATINPAGHQQAAMACRRTETE